MTVNRPSWSELIQVFLRIGLLGFGGPQAHMAMMGDQVVQQRQWVSRQAFAEGLALCEALPGPASSQLAMALGLHCRGALRGLVSGFCFLLPGLVIVLLLSELWRQGQTMAGLTTVLVVVKPVVAAVIWAFVGKLLRQQRQPWQRTMAVSVALGGLLHQFSPLVLPAGLLLLAAGVANRWRTAMGGTLLFLPGLAPWGAALGWAQAPWFWLAPLAGVFLQAGLLVFGGGLVIIPLLQDQVVGMGWLSGPQFLEGVAIGQVSPGPVALTSAFVGYQVGWAAGGGPTTAMAGALVATAAVFLPSVLFVLVGTPLLQRIRRRPGVQRFLAGVLAGVPGAVAAAAVPLTRTSLQGEELFISPALLALFCAALMLNRWLKPSQLVLLGLGLGLAASLLQGAL
ncbi:chromate efflux transporter [Candidatus Synechococcus spongiarum]|uniref:chromate efflux transporter n=1 Tax=Candidatus Synechococcus spongiarum TaxID=431041 RepID=UPI00046F8BD9|nr:chromate efflux transporter [Candidatus Synechococcus spongiarum]